MTCVLPLPPLAQQDEVVHPALRPGDPVALVLPDAVERLGEGGQEQDLVALEAATRSCRLEGLGGAVARRLQEGGARLRACEHLRDELARGRRG